LFSAGTCFISRSAAIQPAPAPRLQEEEARGMPTFVDSGAVATKCVPAMGSASGFGA
jgi:hypothetical protein